MNSYYESVRESIGYVEFQNSPTRSNRTGIKRWRILCALDDEVYTLVNSKEKILQPGEICVADCYDVHSFYSSERPVMIIIIPSEFLNDYIKMKGKKHLATPYITDPETYRKIYSFMREFQSQELPLILQRGYVNVILGLILESCDLEEFADADVSLMKNILNFLEENYHEDVDLDYLAQSSVTANIISRVCLINFSNSASTNTFPAFASIALLPECRRTKTPTSSVLPSIAVSVPGKPFTAVSKIITAFRRKNI